MNFHGKGRPMTEAGMSAVLKPLGLDPMSASPPVSAGMCGRARRRAPWSVSAAIPASPMGWPARTSAATPASPPATA